MSVRLLSRSFVIGELRRVLSSEKRLIRSTAENVRKRASKDIAEDRVDERIGHGGTVAEPGDREPDIRRDT